MSGHTPAPWKCEIDSIPPQRSFTIRGDYPLPRVVARYLVYDDHLRFANEEARPEEVEANAKLIAAAPKLLKALEEIAYISNKVGNSEKEANEMGEIANSIISELS